MKKKCAVLIPALDPPGDFLVYIDELIASGFSSIIYSGRRWKSGQDALPKHLWTSADYCPYS